MFRDRGDAGKRLAESLARAGVVFDIVIGIPRGGVAVAKEIAGHFKCPMDVVMARKIGSPTNEEYAIGAVTPDGKIFVDERVQEFLGFDHERIQLEARRVQREINRRIARYRSGKPGPDLAAKRVLLVDDGIATGFTIKAAVAYLRQQGASYIAIAVPVAAREAVQELEPMVDDFFSLEVPEKFYAVGQFYEDFSPVDDEAVIEMLND
ncbi:MAG: phosphoribosyltransferase [Syntrophomonadaceae bacterium]|jgi:putative phosphoribosyl transferase|nr:phosphoribosyltransferase [Syntrophomonadaceae bacterium]